MKAVVLRKYGPPEALELADIEKPVPGEGEVLVEVHALHTECAACRSKWAGITRAIDKQPNAQAWTLGLHALRVAGACIVYAQREAPEHGNRRGSRQRLARLNIGPARRCLRQSGQKVNRPLHSYTGHT